jgi:hypothetical protein
MIVAETLRGDGTWMREFFLVDSGADRTVFSAVFWTQLKLPIDPNPVGYNVVGISGTADSVLVTTELRFERTDGKPASVTGQFAAFTEAASSDYSILGRDVMNNFDLILSWPRQEVRFLAGNHSYQITSP